MHRTIRLAAAALCVAFIVIVRIGTVRGAGAGGAEDEQLLR